MNAALVALDGSNFHGKRLEAALAWYNFNNIDSSYVPCCIKYNECELLTSEWQQYREKILLGLFEKEIDHLSPQISEHHHPKHNPIQDRVRALQQRREQEPGNPKHLFRIDQATSCAHLSLLRDPEERDTEVPGERDHDDPAASQPCTSASTTWERLRTNLNHGIGNRESVVPGV